MSSIGRTAVVIGAGIAGLAAAGALRPFFERVIVFERDKLPVGAEQRPSIPQGKHLHVLLSGGQRALSQLFPGFERDLSAAGAVRINVARDQRSEMPGYDPFPQRDLGIQSYSLSRPLLEARLRDRVRALSGVTIESGCIVEQIVGSETRVAGVVRRRGAQREEVAADLVIDASARGQLTLNFLAQTGAPVPDVTTVGVDIGYACTLFSLPKGAVPWNQAFTIPAAPQTTRAAMLIAIEEGCWSLSACGRAGDYPSADPAQFMDFLRGLRTQTIVDALQLGERVGDIELFRFRDSRWRHFERLPSFPAGLLPIGDTICRFNPIHGQGMTVAAQQAVVLGNILGQSSRQPQLDVAARFFEAVSPIVADAWSMSTSRDFVYPQTRGERPADLAQTLQFGRALNALAARDADIHKLVSEVRHMLTPNSAIATPHVVERVREFMLG
jgi:2-polyprenyl-6-methoxyphenol hydroxylase-like FAD-dependent oxidoreductase